VNENVENPILAPLRERRAEMGETPREMRNDIAHPDQEADVDSLLSTMLAGHGRGLETRVETL
jgi:hypothetical protein